MRSIVVYERVRNGRLCCIISMIKVVPINKVGSPYAGTGPLIRDCTDLNPFKIVYELIRL